MSEPIRQNADDATAYVLGTLGARERRRFEARLKESAELRAIVRSLEMGSIGLAMAAPRREPPTRLWEGIQAAVTHECQKRERASRQKWLRRAVGLAACAAVGWVAYTILDRQEPPARRGLAIVDNAATDTHPTNQVAPPLARATAAPPAVTNFVSQPVRERRPLRPTESATLRQRVGELESQVAHLTETVNQQQAAPADASRMTFLEIIPEGAHGVAAVNIAAPSPELRRALLLGVARQLGWMPPPGAPAPPLPEPPTYVPPPEPSQPVVENGPGVDFVDLPPVDTPSVQTASVDAPPSSSSPPTSTPTTTTVSSNAPEEGGSKNATSIPAYVSGTNLVFAVDTSLVPVGTQAVSFFSGNATGPSVFRGTLALGNNPLVVTMPLVQLRVWDNSNASSGSPGIIWFNSTSEGSLTRFNFTVANPLPSSP